MAAKASGQVNRKAVILLEQVLRDSGSMSGLPCLNYRELVKQVSK